MWVEPVNAGRCWMPKHTKIHLKITIFGAILKKECDVSMCELLYGSMPEGATSPNSVLAMARGPKIPAYPGMRRDHAACDAIHSMPTAPPDSMITTTGLPRAPGKPSMKKTGVKLLRSNLDSKRVLHPAPEGYVTAPEGHVTAPEGHVMQHPKVSGANTYQVMICRRHLKTPEPRDVVMCYHVRFDWPTNCASCVCFPASA